MKEKVGEVFSIAKENSPVPGCTISKEVHSGENYITYFSLARNTDISAEIYPYHKLLAFFKPYFFLSFILESLVKKPAFFKASLVSGSAKRSALAIPCLIAPA